MGAKDAAYHGFNGLISLFGSGRQWLLDGGLEQWSLRLLCYVHEYSQKFDWDQDNQMISCTSSILFQ